MEVEKLIEQLQVYFPLSLQESWDNSGLQISPKDRFIKAILLALDVTLGTVDEAYEKGCNLIISHHPVIFSSVKKIDKNIYPLNVAYRACELGIGIYSFHTNLDIGSGGLNDFLCNLLGLKDVEILEDVKPVRIGKLDNDVTFDELLDLVRERLGVEVLKYVRSNERRMRKIAVCSGSCMDLLEKIAMYDFDVFLSSDLKHHQAVYAKEMGINVVDATHYHTEKFAKQILKEKIEEIASDLKVFLSDTDSLPWNYSY